MAVQGTVIVHSLFILDFFLLKGEREKFQTKYFSYWESQRKNKTKKQKKPLLITVFKINSKSGNYSIFVTFSLIHESIFLLNRIFHENTS